jgi:hypothetical protein
MIQNRFKCDQFQQTLKVTSVHHRRVLKQILIIIFLW